MTPAADFLTARQLGRLLLILAACAAPQTLHIAPWISGIALLLGVWRYLAAVRGWRLPSRTLRLLLALTGFGGVFASYGSINGVEAGSALLVLMLALKLTETWRRRDCALLVVLGHFLICAEFLYEQQIHTTLYLIPVLWLLTAELLAVTHPGTPLAFRTALSTSGRLLLLALPLMLIMYFLFPRIPGPLWGVGGARGAGVSGLSDSMTPGSISELALSDEIAFRVEFDGEPPPPVARYWRALVLHDFDGRTWDAGWPLRGDARLTPLGEEVTYTITLEPHERNWLYVLDLPIRIPASDYISPDFELRAPRRINERLRYTITSALAYRTGETLQGWARRRDLRLPEDFNPRTHALAAQWRDQYGSNTAAIVQAALAMFRKQPFVYTLQPPLLGRDSVDEFLFDTRRGFCEHYASSFTILMRAAGIPAHVVTGYQGGEQNPFADYFIVRQAAAHAWSEVWLEGRGWVRVDPTAAVAPERVERGLQDALPAGERVSSLFDNSLLIIRLQYGWDVANTYWTRWVLAYGPEAQRGLLDFAGMKNPDWLKMVLWMTGLMAAVGLLIAFWHAWRQRPRLRDPVLRVYNRFCNKLEKQGLPRQDWEGPRAYASRIARLRPELATPVGEISSLYAQLRYGAHGTPAALRRLQQAVKRFRVK